MQFIVKYFPEITIKSKPVRRQMCRQLQLNLSRRLKSVRSPLRLKAGWDSLRIYVDGEDPSVRDEVLEVLSHSPGIAHFLEVVEFPLRGLEDMVEKVCELWAGRLAGSTFVVRCKRSGEHDFTSSEIERVVGAGLLQASTGAGVNLREPDITVRLEVRGDALFIVNQRIEGLGGFPCGSLDPVLSLVSGGFDSTVASYQMMRRGMLTHFLFFNLGGRAHELGVKEISLYLWMKYGASHPVKFVSVPFEPVVAEILRSIDNSHMGVVLKRMMLRAASEIARDMGIEALVTGECIAQVSSQTLTNLAVIDEVTDTLVLRPLIASDKSDIVAQSRAIGAEELAASIPEYCGVISIKPKTRARLDRVVAEEDKFDFGVLSEAIASLQAIDMAAISLTDEAAPDVEVLAVPVAGSVVIDIRHPAEEERSPLRLAGVEVLRLPFYRLRGDFAGLDQARRYLLYCEQGVMSQMQAASLVEQGHANVGVYRPDGAV